MSIVSFTAERSYPKYVLSGIKAALVSFVPETIQLTVSENIAEFDLIEAAYTVFAAYSHFPKQTIHLIFVSHWVSPQKPLLLFVYDDHYFLTADNGFITIFLDIVGEHHLSYQVYRQRQFNEQNVEYNYIEAIRAIQKKQVLETFFEPANDYTTLFLPKVKTNEDEGILSGEILFFDAYGNAVTNIRQSDLAFFENEPLQISLQFYPEKIKEISRYYNERHLGELFALFNRQGFLEIGIVLGNAKELMSLEKEHRIDIEKQ